MNKAFLPDKGQDVGNTVCSLTLVVAVVVVDPDFLVLLPFLLFTRPGLQRTPLAASVSGWHKETVRHEQCVDLGTRKPAVWVYPAPDTGVAVSTSLTAPTSQGCCEGEMTVHVNRIGKCEALNTCKRVSLCRCPSLSHFA